MWPRPKRSRSARHTSRSVCVSRVRYEARKTLLRSRRITFLGWRHDADYRCSSVLVMSLELAAGLALLFACAVGLVACWIDANRKRPRRQLLKRLNSPFFRNVTDAYYRVGNLSGVGK